MRYHQEARMDYPSEEEAQACFGIQRVIERLQVQAISALRTFLDDRGLPWPDNTLPDTSAPVLDGTRITVTASVEVPQGGGGPGLPK